MVLCTYILHRNNVMRISTCTKTTIIIIISCVGLILIDTFYFSTWDKINYFNLVLECFVSLLVLYPFFSIQKYRSQSFYRFLSIGYYLLFISYFVDAIDQVFIHNLYYTVVMEKTTLIVAILFIFVGGKKWMENYQALSCTDELTQLPNRKQLHHLIELEIKRNQNTKEPFSFCIIDIDNFKKVNDTFGHLNGDKVLIEFSLFLKSLIREQDIFGRWGGEEFVLLLKKTEGQEAKKILNRIRTEIEQHNILIKNKRQIITASFGVSEFHGENFRQLFAKADKALYQAKEQGRNQVVVYQS